MLKSKITDLISELAAHDKELETARGEYARADMAFDKENSGWNPGSYKQQKHADESNEASKQIRLILAAMKAEAMALQKEIEELEKIY